MTSSGASMAAETAAASKGSGRPEKTADAGQPDGQRGGIEVDRRAVRVAARHRPRAGDATPVRVPAVDGGLEQVAAHDRPRHRARVGHIGCAGHEAGDERRGPLAVGRLLPRQRSADRGQRRAELRRLGAAGSRRLGRPEAPEASTKTVSLVEVSPSMLVCSKVAADASRRSVASSSGVAAASVSTTAIMVAIRGWIMPTPLATPETRDQAEREVVGSAGRWSSSPPCAASRWS